MWQLRAMRRFVWPPSNFNLRTSLNLRMDNLTAGIWPFLHWGKTGQDTVGLSRVRIAPNPLSEGWQTSPESVAAFAWNQWQACRGTGGSFAMESVADFVWNTHPYRGTVQFYSNIASASKPLAPLYGEVTGGFLAVCVYKQNITPL
jgi:hypothetical protein